MNNCQLIALVSLPLSSLWCVEEIPFQPMHNEKEVIEKFNFTLVLYSATIPYMSGLGLEIYPTDIPNASFGFVSKRSSSWNYQPSVNATHSIKKLISYQQWNNARFTYDGDQESLVTNWSVYTTELKMRLATKAEIDQICRVWCPDDYDFDFEEADDIVGIADRYCCPENICCSDDMKKLIKYGAYFTKQKHYS